MRKGEGVEHELEVGLAKGALGFVRQRCRISLSI